MFSLRKLAITALLVVTLPASSYAASIQVIGGETSVLFGNGVLESVGLEITSVTPNVMGALGPNSISFGINPLNAIGDALDTTFVYETPNFAPFSGAIEHSGRLQFNGTLEVGDFTITESPNRPGGASGFTVTSNFGLMGILFDLANPIVEAFDNSLVIAADLWISPEFAGELGNPELAGADAGMALVVAKSEVIPVPAAIWLFGSGLGLLGWIRLRRTA